MNRRKALARISAAVGGVGVAFAAVPFVRYFYPSARAKALGTAVAVDLSGFEIGEIRNIIWRGQVVFVMRRSAAQLSDLAFTDDRLLDESKPGEAQPDYVDPGYRSVDMEFLVLLGNCTHAGCVPKQDTETGRKLLGGWWPGGFHCPCHDSMYDYAGRVVRGPAPYNLKVPPHRFEAGKQLIIGEDTIAA